MTSDTTDTTNEEENKRDEKQDSWALLKTPSGDFLLGVKNSSHRVRPASGVIVPAAPETSTGASCQELSPFKEQLSPP